MSTATLAVPRKEGLDTRHYWAAFFVACTVLVLRRPDVLIHARFYAEDGSIFYATAYNYGWWKVLFSPYEGYVHLLPRLGAGVALLVPLQFAPLVENAIALGIEALPVVLILSSEWETVRFRALLAGVYLCLPNSLEMLGSIRTSQWILGFCVLLILLSARHSQRVANLPLIAVSSLTGPFCVFLLPFAVYFRRKAAAWMLGAGCIVQSAAYLYARPGHRYVGALGAGFAPFFRILGGQMVFGSVLGRNSLSLFYPSATAVAGLVATAFIAYAFATGTREFGALSLFALLVFAASIWNPADPGKTSVGVWDVIASVAAGNRYVYFPTLVFAWAIAYAFRTRIRQALIALAAIMLIGWVRDFHLPPHSDPQFISHVAEFSAAAPGEAVVIPSVPRGWRLILVKH